MENKEQNNSTKSIQATHETDNEGTIRRRKKGSIGKKEGKISALSKYATHGFEHRVIRGDDARVMELTVSDDWVPVKNENGEVVKQLVGTFEDGKPRYDILVRKRKDWFEEDKKELQSIIDENEKELMRNKKQSTHGDGVELDKMYIPVQEGKAENRTEKVLIRRKAQKPE